MPGPGDQLREFLGRSRVHGLRRTAIATVADAVLGVLALGTIGATIAGITHRGDAVGPIAAAAASLGLVALVATRAVRARATWSLPLGAARTVARTRGRLRRAGSDPAAEAVLRHEILGATELLIALERGAIERSETLARAYVERVAGRLAALEPDLSGPRTRWRPRSMALGVLLGAVVIASPWSGFAEGARLMIETRDGRPPKPPRPVWSSLAIELDYPAHTGRPARTIPNPSGALRVPAGTQVRVRMGAREPAEAASIVVTYDHEELQEAPPPEIVPLSAMPIDERGVVDGFAGAFTVRGTGTWTIVLLDDEDDAVDDTDRRSGALPLELEPDRPPEVELLPLPRSQREANETDVVSIRFRAKDDFGLARAELVYQVEGGETFRLDAGKPPAGARTWSRRYPWDLSAIPIDARSEVTYWLEVRDNDPGHGLEALPDPPGKVTRSATMRLFVRDEESEHAANIEGLRAIRDAAVDLLSRRMTTFAFAHDRPHPPGTLPSTQRIREARELVSLAGALLAKIAAAVDALSIDTLTRERDVGILTDVHGRLMELHRKETKLHERLPPGQRAPADAKAVLQTLARHNVREIGQLEDEIIRLDDLVDGLTMERLEALVARLQATQQKLLELLEQLRAGDESVRPLIEQLEQRRREDLRRLAEARAKLRKELGEEFMNLDAFKALDQMRDRNIAEMLQSGDLDGALERARRELSELQGLRDAVQGRLGQRGEQSRMSPEDRKRMELLRRLSELQDEQGAVRSQTRRLHEQWRTGVEGTTADPELMREVSRGAARLRRKIAAVNDARLGRDGRNGLADAREQLDKLEAIAGKQAPSLLEAAETAHDAAEGSRRAVQDSKADEAEGKSVRTIDREIRRLRDRLLGGLPRPERVLSADESRRFAELQSRQGTLRERADRLLEDEVADILPAPGRQGMRRADRGMQRSGDILQRRETIDAIDGQNRAWQGIQDAIDSLRRSSPPPRSAAEGEASTEAERDRSLRDELLEAMREGAPSGFDEAVERYYEELLR